MTSTRWFALIAIAVFAALGTQVYGEESQEPAEVPKQVKSQTTCPVMGGTIDKSLFVDHDGKRIYLCCQGCEEAVKKDPEKYIKQLEDEGITLDKTPKPQTTCPVMGKGINKKLYVDHQGKRIYVCCRGCVATVKIDPEKYIKKLEAEGIALEKVPEKVPEKKKN